MIRESDAQRVEQWIDEAVAQGARLLAGGGRQARWSSRRWWPTSRPQMRISCDELFGPAVAVTRAATIDEAIRLANDTNYGLSAGIFTQDLDWAMRFAREVDSRATSTSTGARAGGPT